MSEHTEIATGGGAEMSMHIDAIDHGEPVGNTRATPRVALFHADEALFTHVDEALAAMHTQVVYRSTIGLADQDALRTSGASIALINLDADCDDRLDALTVMLDAAAVPVVFNDADISRGLEGWARARWARHLAAKLSGSADVDPPRPAQAPAIDIVEQVSSANDDGSAGDQSAQDSMIEGVVPAPSAARPLTPNEIESLLADFPSETEIASHETVTLSAHVDALLASAAEGASQDPAPWEIVAPAFENGQAAAGSASAFQAQAAKTDPTDWQLLDEPSPVFSAPCEPAVTAVQPVRPDSALDLELEPLEYAAPTVTREPGFEEMRLESQPTNRAGARK